MHFTSPCPTLLSSSHLIKTQDFVMTQQFVCLFVFCFCREFAAFEKHTKGFGMKMLQQVK